MESKKVIVILVEGDTDKIAIGNIVTKIKEDNNTHFKVINYDITSERGSTSANILTKIYEKVKEVMKDYYFNPKDIMKIVHIIDTDGAFIDNDNIKYKEIEKVEYELEAINAKNVEDIKERNLKKSGILSKLSRCSKISNIPYEIYFFSSNLEHVLHNIQNATKEQKIELSHEFEDRFYDKPEEFIKFINDNTFALKSAYNETWDFIKADNNSLHRHTNFNLFFD